MYFVPKGKKKKGGFVTVAYNACAQGNAWKKAGELDSGLAAPASVWHEFC